MSTKITRFRNLLILALMCLISGSVWGQINLETEILLNQFSSFSGSGYKDNDNYSINGYSGFKVEQCMLSGNSLQMKASTGLLVSPNITSTAGFAIKITYTSSTNITLQIGDEPAVSAISPLISETDNPNITFKISTGSKYATIQSIEITPKGSSLPDPIFKFEGEASYTVILGEAFTAPTLTNSSDATPTYESSNTNIATVNAETGEIEILNGGTVTITAFVEATKIYAAASATYTINVKRSKNEESFITGFDGSELPNGWTGNGTFDTTTNHYKTSAPGYALAKDKQLTISAFSNLYELSFWGSTSSGGDGLSLSIEYNTDNTNWISLTSIVLNKGAMVQKNIDLSEISNLKNVSLRFTSPTNTAYLDDIEIIYLREEPKSTIDPTTGAMTLTGAWTAETVKALEIPANVTSVDMTAINVDVLPTTIENPNCLFYVKENSTINEPNVIVGNNAIAVELHDGYDFYNTKSFTGDITYSRTFASGWNTFALPFNTAIPNGVQVEAFDKKDGNQILFTEVTSIEANTAYLINVQAGGEISFTANNVTVPVTATTGDTYKSNFLHMTGDDIAGKYILVMEEGVEVFARANAEAQMHAFRGYLDLPTASGVQYSISHEGGATDINNTDIEGIKIYSINGTLIINADKTQSVQIYGLDGRMVKNIQVSEGENTVTGLAKGIYLINNQKAIIK